MEGDTRRQRTDQQTDSAGVPHRGLSEGTIPGDPLEGSVRETDGSAARGDQEEVTRRLEEGVDAPGSGVLGKGIHVGTPAGGLTEAAATGGAHWGQPRSEEQEEEKAA